MATKKSTPEQNLCGQRTGHDPRARYILHECGLVMKIHFTCTACRLDYSVNPSRMDDTERLAVVALLSSSLQDIIRG